VTFERDISAWFAAVGACLLLVSAASGETTDATNRTVITASRLTFDYERRTAVFEENVVVTDPSMKLESDRLNVIFAQGGGIDSVTAVGHVRIAYGGRHGVCDKAIYLAREGQLILIGHAELSRGGDSVAGDVIRFWIADDRMTCEPGHLIITSGPGGHGPFLPTPATGVAKPGTEMRGRP
jgi:lipopolysaccharide export system protein LptA